MYNYYQLLVSKNPYLSSLFWRFIHVTFSVFRRLRLSEFLWVWTSLNICDNVVRPKHLNKIYIIKDILMQNYYMLYLCFLLYVCWCAAVCLIAIRNITSVSPQLLLNIKKRCIKTFWWTLYLGVRSWNRNVAKKKGKWRLPVSWCFTKMVSECIFSFYAAVQLFTRGESEVLCSCADGGWRHKRDWERRSKVRTHVLDLRVTWGQSAARK